VLNQHAVTTYVGTNTCIFNLAVERHTLSVSRPAVFAPQETTPGTHWIWRRKNHRVSLAAGYELFEGKFEVISAHEK